MKKYIVMETDGEIHIVMATDILDAIVKSGINISYVHSVLRCSDHKPVTKNPPITPTNKQ